MLKELEKKIERIAEVFIENELICDSSYHYVSYEIKKCTEMVIIYLTTSRQYTADYDCGVTISLTFKTFQKPISSIIEEEIERREQEEIAETKRISERWARERQAKFDKLNELKKELEEDGTVVVPKKEYEEYLENKKMFDTFNRSFQSKNIKE